MCATQVEGELAAARARADDTQQLADSLLAQHYNEWVPHWVADGYERVRSLNPKPNTLFQHELDMGHCGL